MSRADDADEPRRPAFAPPAPDIQINAAGLSDTPTASVSSPPGPATPGPVDPRLQLSMSSASPGQPPSSSPALPAPPPKLQSSSPNVVGVHYKVGKKIGEGSFGIIYEGALSRCFNGSIL